MWYWFCCINVYNKYMWLRVFEIFFMLLPPNLFTVYIRLHQEMHLTEAVNTEYLRGKNIRKQWLYCSQKTWHLALPVSLLQSQLWLNKKSRPVFTYLSRTWFNSKLCFTIRPCFYIRTRYQWATICPGWQSKTDQVVENTQSILLFSSVLITVYWIC